ncbi:MAG: PAS domain-containing protein [Anaerolineaceae bacterium]|nr:PAS domain-containing protein [Anaerolineaceae bacterium]
MTDEERADLENVDSPGKTPQARLTVVGIGASAGGVQALQNFFEALPDDTGMVFVVVTHLHPERESHMDEILQLRTKMPVRQVTDQVNVELNHVYLIPPNRRILMTDNHLDTEDFTEPQGQRMPINDFFRSLASVHRDAVGIILSGGGTDGAVGIKAIKEMGGLLMVQHPDQAEYDSMPRAAIATGVVDVVLPVEELAAKLVDFKNQPTVVPQNSDELTYEELDTIQRILAQVQARTGHDFRQYKRSTILRRIQRRMQLNGYSTLGAYLSYLRHDANEAQSMFNDLLIGVTNFFRDRDAWDVLVEQVLPTLFAGKEAGDSVRVWTIGCATGEEAYTLAMLLVEHAASLDIHPQIQVFASDLDETALTRAREGIYPASIESDVNEERLKRFFVQEGDHYRVRRELREMVLFASHSALRDPPFSRLDLISCRNLLIYLQRGIQETVFEIFHYALKPGGYLFLGSSESAEALPYLFEIVDKGYRIYKTRPWPGEHPHVPIMPLRVQSASIADRASSQRRSARRYSEGGISLPSLHQETLESIGPPSILVDAQYQVLHLSETAGRYLLPPKGPITSDLLLLVRDDLKPTLRAALFEAFNKNKAVVSRPVAVQFNGERHQVILSVRPRRQNGKVKAAVERNPVALVVFLEDEHDPLALLEGVEETAAASDQARQDVLVKQLENEIYQLREQLQATMEEYESSNEEMKAANEELQSINEEYRSATEELETSKEELQSVNEELQTVNNELKNKLEEISRAHSDLENLMAATEIATLFLDRDLRIQRFTPGVEALFNIRPVDRGRPIAHLTHMLAYDALKEDARQVLRQLVPLEREVQANDGLWFLMRVRPYRTIDDRIDGVVITFIDINEIKRAEDALRELNESLEEQVKQRTATLDEANRELRQVYDLFFSLFHANPIPTALTRLEGNVLLDVNDAYLRYFGYERDEIIGRTPQELDQWLEPAERQRLIERIQTEGRIRDYEIEAGHPSGQTKVILLSLQHLMLEDKAALIYAFIDITERVEAEQQIRDLSSQLTLAEQEERRRLSEVLHNDLQQRLYAVQVQLGLLRDSLDEKEQESVKEEVVMLEQWLREIISISRNLSIDLSPPLLEDEGLVQSISWLALQMHEQHNLNVSVQSSGEPPHFALSLRVLLYETVRELLFNIVKHAEVSHAQVTLENHNSYYAIIISDHGKGFDAEAMLNAPASGRVGLGLLKIRQRLNLLGNEIEVNSGPGDGTTITIIVPLSNPAQ